MYLDILPGYIFGYKFIHPRSAERQTQVTAQMARLDCQGDLGSRGLFHALQDPVVGPAVNLQTFGVDELVGFLGSLASAGRSAVFGRLQPEAHPLRLHDLLHYAKQCGDQAFEIDFVTRSGGELGQGLFSAVRAAEEPPVDQILDPPSRRIEKRGDHQRGDHDDQRGLSSLSSTRTKDALQQHHSFVILLSAANCNEDNNCLVGPLIQVYHRSVSKSLRRGSLNC